MIEAMTHPRMFDEDDPWLRTIRTVALALPDAEEKISHGRPAFFTKKVFAYYGGSRKLEGEWIQHPQSVMVLPGSDERQALANDDRFYVPAYLGPSGWLGLDLDKRTDIAEIRELVEESYRQTAGAHRVARLDQSLRHRPTP